MHVHQRGAFVDLVPAMAPPTILRSLAAPIFSGSTVVPLDGCANAVISRIWKRASSSKNERPCVFGWSELQENDANEA
jgi:hypothetical protein